MQQFPPLIMRKIESALPTNYTWFYDYEKPVQYVSSFPHKFLQLINQFIIPELSESGQGD